MNRKWKYRDPWGLPLPLEAERWLTNHLGRSKFTREQLDSLAGVFDEVSQEAIRAGAEKMWARCAGICISHGLHYGSETTYEAIVAEAQTPQAQPSAQNRGRKEMKP